MDFCKDLANALVLSEYGHHGGTPKVSIGGDSKGVTIREGGNNDYKDSSSERVANHLSMGLKAAGFTAEEYTPEKVRTGKGNVEFIFHVYPKDPAAYIPDPAIDASYPAINPTKSFGMTAEAINQFEIKMARACAYLSSLRRLRDLGEAEVGNYNVRNGLDGLHSERAFGGNPAVSDDGFTRMTIVVPCTQEMEQDGNIRHAHFIQMLKTKTGLSEKEVDAAVKFEPLNGITIELPTESLLHLIPGKFQQGELGGTGAGAGIKGKS